MKTEILLIVSLVLLSCGQGAPAPENTDTSATIQPTEPLLICVRNADYEPAFVNEKGDTLIPFGTYLESFTDTIRTFGSVYDSAKGFLGIDPTGKELFEIYPFDNGPDYLEDGLFRILKDGLIGYADAAGTIVIEPQFSCAMPFENGRAQVSKNCSTSVEFEMTKMESDDWYYIDKKGQRIE